MVEENNWFSSRLLCQILLNPAENIFSPKSRSMISSPHRCHDIMRRAKIKRVINRAIDTFEQLFSVLPFYKVMISQTIENRTTHIRRIHQLDMILQSVFIANITGMNHKSNLLVCRQITHFVRPIFLIDGIEYFRISNM